MSLLVVISWLLEIQLTALYVTEEFDKCLFQLIWFKYESEIGNSQCFPFYLFNIKFEFWLLLLNHLLLLFKFLTTNFMFFIKLNKLIYQSIHF